MKTSASTSASEPAVSADRTLGSAPSGFPAVEPQANPRSRDTAPRRYDLGALLAMMGCTLSAAQVELGIGGPEYRKYNEQGMSREVAERKADRAGFHVYEVWPEMVEHDLELLPVCAAERCEERFVPRNSAARYCSARCRNRENHRRWLKRHPDVYERVLERNRRYRQETAKAQKISRRRRYELNGDEVRAKRRERYRLNAEVEKAKERERKARRRTTKVEQREDQAAA